MIHVDEVIDLIDFSDNIQGNKYKISVIQTNRIKRRAESIRLISKLANDQVESIIQEGLAKWKTNNLKEPK